MIQLSRSGVEAPRGSAMPRKKNGASQDWIIVAVVELLVSSVQKFKN